jgi:rhodanese-related sulfurtransferase
LVCALDTEGVRRQLEAGAQLLEVLPEADFREEHLPGAVNIPMPELTEERARAELDPQRAIVVYCYDTQCDLSARGAALLEVFGFEEVYDYSGSKAAWLALGLPYEGTVPVEVRAGHLARPAATCAPDCKVVDLPPPGPGGVVLVVDDECHVLGSIRPEGTASGGDGVTVAVDVAHPAPSSVRPSIQVDELGRSMEEANESYVVVSRLDGVLLGIVERGDLDVDR